jgi:hypothetical protein
VRERGKRNFPRGIDGDAELEAAVAGDAASLMVAQNWKRSCSLSWCRPLNRHDAGDEEATVHDTRALGRRTRTLTDASISLRRRKPRLNKGYIYVAVDRLTKMRRAIKLDFSRPSLKQTKTDIHDPFGSEMPSARKKHGCRRTGSKPKREEIRHDGAARPPGSPLGTRLGCGAARPALDWRRLPLRASYEPLESNRKRDSVPGDSAHSTRLTWLLSEPRGPRSQIVSSSLPLAVEPKTNLVGE